MQNLLGTITHNAQTFSLTGGENNASDILHFLRDYLPDAIIVHAGAFLSMTQAKIVHGTVQDLSTHAFDTLFVLSF